MSEQHPLGDRCFYCATDVELARGIERHDRGLPWDGRTIHMQLPESACPYVERCPVSELPRLRRHTDVLTRLADEIDSQAAISSRFGQLADLERIAADLRTERDRINQVLGAAQRVLENAHGTKPRHTRARAGGCRDDCIPCGLEALRVAISRAGILNEGQPR